MKCPTACSVGSCGKNPVDAFVEVPCRGGYQCHPIQWPYNMRGCYPDATALEDCARETTRVSGKAIAFSLQDCYDEPKANKKYCFIYQNAPANPKECQIDVFSQDQCIYGTKDGAFYILKDEYGKRFTDDSENPEEEIFMDGEYHGPTYIKPYILTLTCLLYLCLHMKNKMSNNYHHHCIMLLSK